MNTMIGLVALLTSVASSNIQTTPNWTDGYSSARQAVVSAQKPMAVFFGKGATGWEKVLKDGSFDSGINQTLASKYICLYVDVTTWEGYNLAKTFEVAGKGLVISDISGKKQAFNLTGELTKADLKEKLETYAKAETKVSHTETVVHATEAMLAPAAPATTYFQSSCANGNCTKATSYYQPSGNCPNGNCPKATTSAAPSVSYYQPAGNCPNGNCPKAMTSAVPSVSYYQPAGDCPNGNCPKRR